MTRLRVALGVVGLLMLGYGAVRILQFPHVSRPLPLLGWLAAALVLHDGVLVPLVTALGWVLARVVPGRARAYVQGALVVAGVVGLLVLVLHSQRGRGAPGNALLTADYLRGGSILIALIVFVTAAAYAGRVLRDRRTTTRAATPTTNSPDA